MKKSNLDNLNKLFTFTKIDTGAAKTLFLLHGTGGSEHDLLPLVESLQGQYNLVGLRGNVLEQGLRRFFVRTALGVFDQVSIATETAKLAQFLQEWQENTQLRSEQLAFLGYSNGANMILATLLKYPELIRTAVLWHGMLPSTPPVDLELLGSRVLATYGEQDSMITADQSRQMVTVLQAAGAEVEVVAHAGGHELRREEVTATLQFLDRE
jgi:phospholipase/carboxylesterase